MDLEVAAVDAVVVGDDELGQLDVDVLERLERAVELLDDEVEAAERERLELGQRSWKISRVTRSAELPRHVLLGARVARAW